MYHYRWCVHGMYRCTTCMLNVHTCTTHLLVEFCPYHNEPEKIQ